MEITLENIAQEVWTLKGAYNGISDDVKEIKADGKELYKKTELIERIKRGNASLKTEIITKLIIWMVGLQIAFGTLMITALWAILNFALK